MADNAPPRMFRHQLFAAAKAPRVRAGSAQATQTGAQEAGLSSAFGGGTSRGVQPGDVTDPVVSGDFDRTPAHTNLFGVMGGDLTPKGKEQQATNQRLQQFGQAYQSAIDAGATSPEAFRAATKMVPSAWQDLMAHPQALRSVENLTAHMQALSGDTNVGTTAQGQVLKQDAQGNLRYENIPGFQGPVPKPTAPHVLSTSTGIYTLDANGKPVPTLNPSTGEQLMPPAKGKTATSGLAPSDIDGLSPQETSNNPKTQFNRQNYNALIATPEVMGALQRMQTAAEAMGPLKGPLAALSGEYFGLNGSGAQFKADQDLIRTQANKLTGSVQAANVKNFMEGIGTASNAPSFIKLQAGQMLNTLRNEGQELADKETADHYGKLPTSLVGNLTKVGIVPNGYQNQQTFDNLPPGEAALWKSRFAPQALSDADKSQLALDAANGKFGPPNAQNTNADFKNIVGIRQRDRVQEQARQQQQTASTAAQAAQASPTQQPQQPAQQDQQQPQQQPAPAPQNQQGNGQQGQSQQPQQPGQGNFLIPGTNTPLSQFMPPTAIPGQPAQGVPATGTATPIPPPSPLPLTTSQTLTPQGGMPTPTTQAPAEATAPLTPGTMKTLQDAGVETKAIQQQEQELEGASASAPIPRP